LHRQTIISFFCHLLEEKIILIKKFKKWFNFVFQCFARPLSGFGVTISTSQFRVFNAVCTVTAALPMSKLRSIPCNRDYRSLTQLRIFKNFKVLFLAQKFSKLLKFLRDL